MKISEFLKQKLNNFKLFIHEELQKITIPEDKKNKLVVDIIYYEKDINLFIQSIIQLSSYDIDNAIKLFLLKYDIDINAIKDKIDYDKLKRYLECFIDVVKK